VIGNEQHGTPLSIAILVVTAVVVVVLSVWRGRR